MPTSPTLPLIPLLFEPAPNILLFHRSWAPLTLCPAPGVGPLDAILCFSSVPRLTADHGQAEAPRRVLRAQFPCLTHGYAETTNHQQLSIVAGTKMLERACSTRSWSGGFFEVTARATCTSAMSKWTNHARVRGRALRETHHRGQEPAATSQPLLHTYACGCRVLHGSRNRPRDHTQTKFITGCDPFFLSLGHFLL